VSYADKIYQTVLLDVLGSGDLKTDRTGTGTYSTFGNTMKFDIRKGFPLLTIKKMHFKSIIVELLWLIRGNSNLDYMKENNVTIWDEWVKPDGTIGPGYPTQWRAWQGINGTHDQLKQVITDIQNTPDSRRLIVSAWNVDCIKDMALPPCHFAYQFNVVQQDNIKYIDIIWYQRSADMFLGVPFNIASYAALLMIVGKLTNTTPRFVVGSFADTHIYTNHTDQVIQVLRNDPDKYDACSLVLDDSITDIDDLNINQFQLIDYQSYPRIAAPVAV
jgi:thymidylate synthase